MVKAHGTGVPQTPANVARRRSTDGRLILPGIAVKREGRIEPFLRAHPTLSSDAVCWTGVAVEDYSIPACLISRHEHVENFVHVVLRGRVKYEVRTRGRTLRFGATPGTTFILPRGTIDELLWEGPTHRIAASSDAPRDA